MFPSQEAALMRLRNSPAGTIRNNQQTELAVDHTTRGSRVVTGVLHIEQKGAHMEPGYALRTNP